MKKLILAALTVLAFSVSAHASVIYNFEAFSTFQEGTFASPKSFTLTAPNYITSNSSFSTPDPNFISSDYGSAIFIIDAVLQGYTATPSQAITVGGNNFAYYFSPYSFDHDGTYDSILFGSGQAATLTVSEGGSGAPVPEPGTMALLGIGMAGLAIFGKRRANKA